MSEMYRFAHERDVSRIIEIIGKIKDDRTVIMAPKIGNSKGTRDTKLRVYSYGGRIIELSTTKQAKCCYLPDKNYVPAGYTAQTGVIRFEDLDENKIREAISFAEKRANGEKKTYEERSVETALIYKNRAQKDAEAIIVDMEFECPKDWLGEVVKMRNNKKSETGKPDLVIYDKSDKSFGIVELKCMDKNCGNMEKHFVDFVNMVKSEKICLIKQEFVRKIKYLEHYGIISGLSDEDLCEAESSDVWMAFLFVGGDFDFDKCQKRYENTRICDIIDRKCFGFQYYQSLDCDMDFSKKAFEL